MPPTDDDIPSGGLCYRVMAVEPGEVVTWEAERFGKEVRQRLYGNGASKQVLCPFWQRTDAGTVRCQRSGEEELDDWYPTPATVALQAARLSDPELMTRIPSGGLLSDEVKTCGIHEEGDD